MVIFTMSWDLPTEHEKLRVYANKARADWIPVTANWPGVTEVSTFRNPMQQTPQALTVIRFSDLTDWQNFIASRDYQRMMQEVRTLGCTAVTTRVWLPSSLTPEPVHPGDGPSPAKDA